MNRRGVVNFRGKGESCPQWSSLFYALEIESASWSWGVFRTLLFVFFSFSTKCAPVLIIVWGVSATHPLCNFAPEPMAIKPYILYNIVNSHISIISHHQVGHPSKQQHGGGAPSSLSSSSPGPVELVEVPLPCDCQQDSRRCEISYAAPPKWVRGSSVDPAWGNSISWRPRGQQVSRRSSGAMEARRGGLWGLFHFHFHFREKVKVVLTFSLLLFFLNLCQCLRRAWGR